MPKFSTDLSIHHTEIIKILDPDNKNFMWK